MSLKDLIKKLQTELNKFGEKLSVDGDYGPKTTKSADKYDIHFVISEKPERVENPAYIESRKYIGKKETDSKFGAFVSTMWSKVGLPHYKTIIGSSFAWCAIWIGLMNSEVGQEYMVKRGAAAISYDSYGISIDYKKNGIPRGSVVRINSSGKCTSSSGNHVMFADGDCSVEDVNKSGATLAGLGGNQSNQVKRSIYRVSNICSVSWPREVALPPKITKSVNCTGTYKEESTR